MPCSFDPTLSDSSSRAYETNPQHTLKHSKSEISTEAAAETGRIDPVARAYAVTIYLQAETA